MTDAERIAAVIPGVMHCAKCKFVLNRVTLHVNDGGVSAGHNNTEPCPNGCGPLWPMTWRQQTECLYQDIETLQAEVRQLKSDHARAWDRVDRGDKRAASFEEELEQLKSRVAKAPRAWAVRYGKGPIVPGDCFQRKEDADRRARAFDVRVVPVALVELKPEEWDDTANV